MTVKALKSLVATLRAEGVARYREKTARSEVELELFSQPPARATAEPTRPTESLRPVPAVPEPLRKVLSAEQWAEAQAVERRLYGEG